MDTSQEIIFQIENEVSSFLNTFAKGTRFLAAVSGGADSMALLAVLCAIGGITREALPVVPGNATSDSFHFSCVHIEHGLRPAHESGGDADHVRGFCGKNGIKCFIKRIAPGKIENFAKRKGTGIEAAARFFRHTALSKYAARLGENTVILLAHTKDDMLETALMRLLRGSGPAGLAQMPAVSGRNGYVIARPLLQLSRAEIECYLKAKNVAWREDSTNADEKYLRNRIRHRLVPLLEESFASWKAGIAQMTQTQLLAADFIAKEAKERVKWEVSLKFSDELLFTDEANFFAQPQIIREEAVYQAVNDLSFLRAFAPRGSLQIKSIKRKVIRQFCEGGVNTADLGKYNIKLEKGKIFVFKKRKEYFESRISRLLK